jgi:hypothetical protein
MPGYLPRGWKGKRVSVLFGRESGGGFDATLVNDNDGGVQVELVEEQAVRRMFIPWSAVRYIELREEPTDERQGVTIGQE